MNVSLQTAKSKLIKEIKDALLEQKDAGTKDDADPDKIFSDYSTSVASAIQTYIEAATIIGTATVPPRVGIAPLFGVGNASGGPEMFVNGKVSFSSNTALKSALDDSQSKTMTDGSKDDAKPDDIIATLAKEVSNGVHNFATSAIVTIDLPTTPGKPVIGFMMLTSPAPAPVPAVTMGAMGKGIGDLS